MWDCLSSLNVRIHHHSACNSIVDIGSTSLPNPNGNANMQIHVNKAVDGIPRNQEYIFKWDIIKPLHEILVRKYLRVIFK